MIQINAYADPSHIVHIAHMLEQKGLKIDVCWIFSIRLDAFELARWDTWEEGEFLKEFI